MKPTISSDASAGPGSSHPDREANAAIYQKIKVNCDIFLATQTRGQLGMAIAKLALLYSPNDIQKMKRNFGYKIQNLTPEYRNRLEEKVAEHLLGTWQTIRLLYQQGTLATMTEPVPTLAHDYWKRVAGHCAPADARDDIRLRFLKFLLAGFSMFVQKVPAHAVGTPFPGGDSVELIDGVYYCPVREKANDVDAALCPFCPALQTPAIGYLKPPINPSEHRKQEFIRNLHDFHNFNG
ncbi:MAG: DUF2115 domain-containing protein [Methanoregula sp.]|nr:DUF2115 domain-containing protein [Methanoregula sp.]